MSTTPSERLRILLVGGTGFLGSHVARALIDAGHEVVALSRGSRPPVDGAGALIADRSDIADLSRAIEGSRFDATIDFTAYDASDVERLLLIPYAALGRYVLISSGQVCLATQAPRIPYTEDDSEYPLKPEPPPDSPDHPQWSYGVGKRRAESALLALRASHGVRGIALRLPVLFGEGDSSLRLWGYIERLRDGGPILMPDGGTRPVRFLYAGDAARFLRGMLASPPPKLGVYHLAQPDVLTLREAVERMARLVGVTPHFVDVTDADLASAGLDRRVAPFSSAWVSVLEPARAAAEFGFLASRYDDYLPRVVRWHLEHPPADSHPGYASREQERALAARLEARTG